MFGFLRPAAGDVAYRQIYAGLCAAQHRQAGLRTLPMLSYEAVFMYQMAVDCCPCEAIDCCYGDNCWPDKRKKTHSVANQPAGGDEAIGVVEAGGSGPSSIGRAVGALRPFGVLEVDGQRHPARSASGFIEDGAEVVVTGGESFGLVVQSRDDSDSA